jgi:hypothetical protein
MPDPSHHCSIPTQNKVPSTGRKSYHSNQEGDWWQQSQSPERFEDEYSELEAAFIVRPTPGGYKSKSAPGQSKSPSVRRKRRDDFELEPQTSRVTVTVATSPLPDYYDRTFSLLMGLCRVDPNPSPFLLRGPVLSLPTSLLTGQHS